MAEIVEFKRNFLMRGNYDCIQDLSTDNLSGRYVRESDYAVLLERHRRLVAIARDCLPKEYKLFSVGYISEALNKLQAALAEEE